MLSLSNHWFYQKVVSFVKFLLRNTWDCVHLLFTYSFVFYLFLLLSLLFLLCMCTCFYSICECTLCVCGWLVWTHLDGWACGGKSKPQSSCSLLPCSSLIGLGCLLMSSLPPSPLSSVGTDAHARMPSLPWVLGSELVALCLYASIKLSRPSAHRWSSDCVFVKCSF